MAGRLRLARSLHLELRRLRSRAVRIHRQARRSRSALHAVADRAGRHRRPRVGRGAARRRLPDSEVTLSGSARAAAGARPRRRLRRRSATCSRRSRPIAASSARCPTTTAHLHWAQAAGLRPRCCAGSAALAGLDLALVYFDIASQRETVLRETHDGRRAASAFFEAQCERFLRVGRRRNWRTARRATRRWRRCAFPHPAFRPGQRALAEAVYRAASAGRRLLAQAPTGIGKTVGTLFPLLKAAPAAAARQDLLPDREKLGRGSWRSTRWRRCSSAGAARARTGRARQGLRAPRQGLPRRVVPARARLLRPPARRPRRRGRSAGGSTSAALRELALQHEVCPYYLAQELARWGDVVVGDYNYYFDASALLHGLTLSQRVARRRAGRRGAQPASSAARQMYSAPLDPAALRRAAPRRGTGRSKACSTGCSAPGAR